MSWLQLRRWLLGIYVLLFLVGWGAFLLKNMPAPLTPPIAQRPAEIGPQGQVDWASIWAGARVRVSNWDRFRNHHPLYLIDEEPQPTQTEKWASLREQPTPWLEVHLARPHDLSRIDLVHAGWREEQALTNDHYLIRCFSGSRLVSEVGVIGNRESVALHPIDCPDTDRIWVGFDCLPGSSNDVARLYEIRAWGEP